MRFAAAPLAELAAAHRSTGIPNIVAGIPLSLPAAAFIRIAGPLLGTLLTWQAARASHSDEAGPSAAVIAGMRSRVWAEAGNAAGQRVAAVLETGEGYRAAAAAAMCAVELQLHEPRAGRSHTSTSLWPGLRATRARHTHRTPLTSLSLLFDAAGQYSENWSSG